jgi:hypothetical protein
MAVFPMSDSILLLRCPYCTTRAGFRLLVAHKDGRFVCEHALTPSGLESRPMDSFFADSWAGGFWAALFRGTDRLESSRPDWTGQLNPPDGAFVGERAL